MSEHGNRRWFPISVTVEMVDFESLRAEVPQIWAEAMHRYKAAVKKYGTTELPLFLRDPASFDKCHL